MRGHGARVNFSLTPSDIHPAPARDVSHDVVRLDVRAAVRLRPAPGEVREQAGAGEVGVRRIDQHGAERSASVVVFMRRRRRFAVAIVVGAGGGGGRRRRRRRRRIRVSSSRNW